MPWAAERRQHGGVIGQLWADYANAVHMAGRDPRPDIAEQVRRLLGRSSGPDGNGDGSGSATPADDLGD